jgi:hypothetical protein
MNQAWVMVQGLLSMDMDLPFRDLRGQEAYYLIILPLVNVVEVFAQFYLFFFFKEFLIPSVILV